MTLSCTVRHYTVDRLRKGTCEVDDSDTTKEALLKSLDSAREHVLGILDGLDASALSKPVLPTNWSCIGMVNHLAVDVERFWFRQTVAGQRLDEGADSTSAWQVSPDTPPEEVLALYRDEIEKANAIIAATPLDAEPEHWPEHFGSWRLPDLGAVMLHVITETACHAGHLDAARELLDGTTWLVLT
jgi:Protein of unknown function (DUF664)